MQRSEKLRDDGANAGQSNKLNFETITRDEATWTLSALENWERSFRDVTHEVTARLFEWYPNDLSVGMLFHAHAWRIYYGGFASVDASLVLPKGRGAFLFD